LHVADTGSTRFFTVRCGKASYTARMNALRACLWAAGLAIGLAQPASAATDAARVIVAFKPEAALMRARALSANASRTAVAAQAQQQANALAESAGVPLSAGRLFGDRSMVVRAQGVNSATLAARLAQRADVAYAVPDVRRRAFAVPNDPLFGAGPSNGLGPAAGQWYLRAPDATVRSATNAAGAWDRVTGSPSLVVAVVDSGVLSDHPDLAGRVLPGYDLIEDLDTANDGDGRDANASDPGDWITAAEDLNARGPFFQCGQSDSLWHGTQVAGIIGAAADNGIGMAGTAHGVRILPVRVLGKCGGYDSDIIAGMYWAAGKAQQGLPGSTTPARVLNLSLGGSGACSQAYKAAINELAAAPYRAVVVAAAGNSTGHAVGTPANCPGVISVTGLRHTGSKVGFADLGPEVTIAAPAGNCVNIDIGSPCLYPILTTTNVGTRGPVAGGSTWSDSFNASFGTSFSAPIVAGGVALMLSARPSLAPADLIATLKRTARPFPTTGSDNGADDPTPVPMCRQPDGTDQLQCYCTVGLCGAGMLDIGAAVLDAQQGVSLSSAAAQLFAFAESDYASLFHGAFASGTSGPFRYRFYPDTALYLGVVVQSDSVYALNGVYVLNAADGHLQYVGQLTDYIQPR
jgi:serine protease